MKVWTTVLIRALFVGAMSLFAYAAQSQDVGVEADGMADARIHLGLTESERVEFLAEMRLMLASIQGIIAGIGVGDRERIIEAARYSGNRMARATPASVRAKLPKKFQEIGGPTHMLFEEIVIRAEDDEMASLAELTGRMMQNCLACHAMFRVQ